jgi:glycosyltransferase involved in cell wall biosynthesis
VLKSNRERYRRLVGLANVEMTLLAPTSWIENCVREPYQADATDPFPSILGAPTWSGRELRSMYWNGAVAAIRRARPEIILLMEESFSMFALQILTHKRLLAPRARVIFYSNNTTSYRRYPYRPSWLYRLLGDHVMAGSDVGLCVNARAVEVLRDSIFGGEIRELFYGINDALFQPVSRCDARRALGIAEDVGLFLYAGRLLEQKGVQDLIEAFARLRAGRPGERLKLLVVGDGEYREALHAHAAAHLPADVVEFRSAVPIEQMASLMSAATAFVLPSRAEWNEQFGRVNAEAMLVGTTIIGSTSGAIPAVIGDGGFIFEAGNVGELCSAMARVLDDPGEAARRRGVGRRIALARYSVGGFVDGLIGVLEDLSGRRLRREVKG